MNCYVEHDYVYVARSSINEEYDLGGFCEYYMCIGCGKTAELVHEAGIAYGF